MDRSRKVFEDLLSRDRISERKLNYGETREPLFEARVVTIGAPDSPFVPSREGVIIVNCAAGNIDINLPACITVPGRIYAFNRKDATANTCHIHGNGAETVDGSSPYLLGGTYQHVMIVNDGVNWYSI